MDCFLGMCRYGLLPTFLNDLLASWPWWRLRWWGAAPRLTNFIPRLRTFCNANGLLRVILLVAADTVDEDLAKHGKTFQKTCLNLPNILFICFPQPFDSAQCFSMAKLA